MLSSLPEAVGRVAVQVLRRGGPSATLAILHPSSRQRLAGGLQALARGLGADDVRDIREPRHPLAPAAVRVERSRLRRGEERGDQYAVTMWFGEGPSLPAAPSPSSVALRSAARVGAGVLTAAAIAAATTVAARIDAAPRQRRIVDAEPGRPTS